MTDQSSTPAKLIRLRGVTKIYGSGDAEVRALDGVDLDIDQGEFVAIMGPSGSGKSTAMNVIGCLDEPTDGQYQFSGIDVGRLSRSQRALLRRSVRPGPIQRDSQAFQHTRPCGVARATARSERGSAGCAAFLHSRIWLGKSDSVDHGHR